MQGRQLIQRYIVGQYGPSGRICMSQETSGVMHCTTIASVYMMLFESTKDPDVAHIAWYQ